MEPHPDDVTAADDLTLVTAARAGDRLAFGVLYLRHHAAAWRVACVVSKFSPDAELAVIEGFTRVFSALPAKPEAAVAGGVSFRPYLLACVRQSALERARAAGRTGAVPAPLAGLSPDGEIVLSSLEHHVARGALASLPERARTALWLSEVEALTPAEIAGLLGGEAKDIPAFVGQAGRELHAASQAALVGHEVRAECRFTVANLDAYDTGSLDPAQGVLVRSHLDDCPTCRMRLGELANGPATLAAAVPEAPLLGGESQHHWLMSLGDLTPADRWMAPVVAAVASADLPLPARRLLAAAAGVPVLVRRAGRTVRPVLPVVSLVVAWLAVLLSLPMLLEPDTASGPAGTAMPAVQAYTPDYLPGTTTTRPAKTSPAAPPPGNEAGEPYLPPLNNAGAAGGTELAIKFDADEVAEPAPDPGAPVKLVATHGANRPAQPKPTGTVTNAVTNVGTAPATVVTAVTPLVATVPLVGSTATGDTSKAEAKAAAKAAKELQKELDRTIRARVAAVWRSAQLDVASLRSKAREDIHGRVARQQARRRHTDHPESA